MKAHTKGYLLMLFICFLFFCKPFLAVAVLPDSFKYKIMPLTDVPQNEVNCIFKDSKGFIWIGTLDGLHRYDGYQYKTYRLNDSGNSISSNMIHQIEEDKQGNIWISTYGRGICRLDPRTERFTHFSITQLTKSSFHLDDVPQMALDKEDNIWIGNSYGLVKLHYDVATDSMDFAKLYTEKTLQIKERSNIKGICVDKRDQVWFGTNKRLYRLKNKRVESLAYESFELSTHRICVVDEGVAVGGKEVFLCMPSENKADTYTCRKIVEENADELYYANQVLWVGDRTGLTLVAPNKVGHWTIIQKIDKTNVPFPLSSNVVTSIAQANKNQIWVGTRGGGLFCVKYPQKLFHVYKHTAEKGSISNNLTRTLFEDSYGHLWIGDEEKGASVLLKGKSYQQGFKHYAINTEPSDQGYAFAEMFPLNPIHHKSIIWAGTNYPLCLVAFDGETRQRIPLPKRMSNVGFTFCLFATDDTTLWAGTYKRGLVRIKMNAEGMPLSFDRFMMSDKHAHALSSNTIRSIYKDSKGDLWIGTDKGVNIVKHKDINRKVPLFYRLHDFSKRADLSDVYVLQIKEISDHIMAFGSMGSGLILYNQKRDTCLRIGTKEGLSNRSIKSIEEDKNHNLWLSSNRGLSCYHPKTGEVINYDEKNGLPDNEFSEICSVTRRDDTIVMGSFNGFVVYHPDEIKTEYSLPRLYFTELMVNNKQVVTGEKINGRVLLPQAMIYTKEITLKYAEHNFAVDFVGVHYNVPLKNEYQYRLIGFDSTWKKVRSNNRFAPFTNIPEGDYTLEVLGSNSDKIWTQEPIRLKIKILPPASRSAKAYLLYFLISCFLLYLLYRIANKMHIRKQELYAIRLGKQKGEELLRYKAQFYTNVSHEFRTPLTLINIPLEQLIEEWESKEGLIKPIDKKKGLNELKIVKHNVNKLLRLVNHFMMFRKIETGHVKPKIKPVEMNAFLESVYQIFTPLAKKRKIDFSFIPAKGEVWCLLDTDMFDEVMDNLLSNAFKFTPEGKKINILLAVEKKTRSCCLWIKDTGEGMSTQDLKHAFQPYYEGTNKSYMYQAGTGIGLSLTKKFMHILQGDITLESQLNEGTTCLLHLPWIEGPLDSPVALPTQTKIQRLEEDPFLPVDETPRSMDGKEAKINTKGPIIVFVDDNKELQRSVQKYLSTSFRVEVASNGEEGLALCRHLHPKAIITDVMMPVMDGLAFTKAVKEDESISHIPILILTAKHTVENRLQSLSTGVDVYMDKPFNIQVLSEQIKSLIHNRALIQKKFQSSLEVNPDLLINSSADAKFLHTIIELINRNMDNTEYTVEALAQQYGVSRIYLNRKIKALTDETSTQFMRNIRMKHAAKLLLEGNLNVSEVALAVGYSDKGTFRTRFKAKFHVTPADFNKKRDN